MNSTLQICSIFLSLLLLIPHGFCLECYECEEEIGNYNCVTVTKNCLVSQDTCLSIVKYTTPKNTWNPLGERRHYVSKGCLDKASCDKMKAMYNNRCTRERYNDWTCVECCEGDGCNYNVYISGPALRANAFFVALLASAVVALFSRPLAN